MLFSEYLLIPRNITSELRPGDVHYNSKPFFLPTCGRHVDAFARTVNVSLHHESDNAGQHWLGSDRESPSTGIEGEGVKQLQPAPKSTGAADDVNQVNTVHGERVEPFITMFKT